MHTIKSILCSLFILLLAFSGRAEEANSPAEPSKLMETILADADSAYNRGDFKEAVALYSELLSSGEGSASLLYDLGNAAYRDGDYGLAVLSYRRALRYAPGDKEILNNLGVVRNKVEDANRAELKGKKYSVAPDDFSFFESVKKNIAEDVSSNTWAGWAAVCFFLALVCAAVYLFSRVVVLRKGGFFGGLVILGIALIFLIFSFMAASEFKSKTKAVIMEYKVELRSEPDSDSKIVGTPLTRGTELTILETDDSDSNTPLWYKVRFNHNFLGWVRADDIKII